MIKFSVVQIAFTPVKMIAAVIVSDTALSFIHLKNFIALSPHFYHISFDFYDANQCYNSHPYLFLFCKILFFHLKNDTIYVCINQFQNYI